ncbi:hypothetical protein [Streptomyces sp. NPDC059894]|uniref:hypothetical protein n=1 Tax=unclassified Streptomyces TaxID=2593676 RepID=UPI00365E3558
MGTWSDSPFTSREELSGVPQGTVISRDNGESRLVYEIEGSPGWLAKLYKRPADAGRASDLQRLVYLPTVMSQADQDLVDRCLSWPTTRLYDGSDLVGVVMAKAPDGFYAPLKALSGWKDPVPLPLDWLMQDADKCAQVGLRPPDRGTRLRAVEELLAVGDLFARHDIVYGDWSYRNALWNQHTGEVFVIDMDSCGIGSREWVESPGWADPLFPDRSRRPTVASDSYKLAVLTVRCLTAQRQDPLDALRAMEASTGDASLTGLLRRTLTAARPQDRPECAELLAAVRRIRGTTAPGGPAAGSGPAAGADNVTTWVKVGPRAGSAGTAHSSRAASGAAGANGAAASNVTGSVNLRDRSAARPPASAPTPSPSSSSPSSTGGSARPGSGSGSGSASGSGSRSGSASAANGSGTNAASAPGSVPPASGAPRPAAPGTRRPTTPRSTTGTSRSTPGRSTSTPGRAAARRAAPARGKGGRTTPAASRRPWRHAGSAALLCALIAVLCVARFVLGWI